MRRQHPDTACEFGHYAEDYVTPIWVCGEPGETVQMADGGTATVCSKHYSWLPSMGTVLAEGEQERDLSEFLNQGDE